jgi:predicted alpha/beta-fold hydrolase
MLHKARLFPQDFDRNRLEGIRSLREFDDKITAYYCGFQGAVDYYDRASAAHVVGNIAVPALILHSANDPFIRITPDTRRKIQANPNIKFIETEDGGHCAFIGQRNGTASEGLSPDVNHSNKDDGYWAETQIVNFLQQFR